MMKTTAKSLIVAATAIGATLTTATAANAWTLSQGYGHTSFNWDNYHDPYYGTVYDDASDSDCVRAYGKGDNNALGWGNGNYRGQTCGVGDDTSWSESPTANSDNYAVSLCKGMPNSTRSNCTPYYRQH